jgi:signal transduction histidine kinase
MYGLIAAVAVLSAVAGRLGLLLLRSRRAHRAAIAERGRLLERERQSAAESAVDAERARIARELHDIVSHNVSLMVVQASAAREVLATMPGEAQAALQAVEGAGRAAMTELRHLLGLLAPAPDGHDDADGPAHVVDPGDTELSPSPGLTRLDTLIDRFAFAGLPAEARIWGDPRPLPPGVDATAYRIVQEALTNALKHAAPGAKAEVSIRYAEHQLRVEVLNTGPSVLREGEEPVTTGGGVGRGLLGLRERVALYGGDLDARRRLGGGYRVRARIPLEWP